MDDPPGSNVSLAVAPEERGLQQGLDADLLQALRPLAAGLAAMFAVLAGTKRLVVVSEYTFALAVIEAAIAMACLLVYLRLRHGLPVSFAHPIAAVLALAVCGDIAAHMIIRGEPMEVIGFVTLIIAVGFFVNDPRWFLPTLTLLVATSILATWLALPGPPPGDLVLGVLQAVVVGSIVFIYRRASLLEAGRNLRRVEARTRRLETMTRELGIANKELETFAYTVSHDLRAPLRAIEFDVQTLREDHTRELHPDARESVVRIQRQTERMRMIIEDLLSLSRSGRADLRVEDVDLSALGASVVEELRRREPGRDVDVTIEPGLVARGDPGLLRVVLENLLSNAWKYTRPRARALVHLGHLDGSPTAFYVRDNGVGFDPNEADKLFVEFRRLHSGAQFEGTGVGLATVKRIVERHSGRVWAQSDPAGGATFAFTLGRT